MLRILALLVCALVVSSISFAQKDFRPGYVVKSGDTLKGFLLYGRKRATESAVFKSKKREKSKRYTAADVSAYGFPGDKHYVAIDVGTASAPQKVFALALQKGEIDLYYSKDKYILFKENKMTVLDRKPDSIVQAKKYGEVQSTFQKDVRFVQELNMLISSDCGLNANNIQFSRRQISALIGKYNKCRKNHFEMVSTKPAATIGASLSFGIYGSTLILDSIRAYDFKADVASVLQLDAEVKFPKFIDRLTITVGIQPVKTTYRTTTIVKATSQTRYDDLVLQVKYLKLPLSLKYNFGNPGNSIFVRLGAWQGIFNDDVKFTAHRTFRSPTTDEVTGESDINVRNGYRNPGGFMVGVGYDKSIAGRLRVFAEFRYESNSGFVGLPVAPYSGFDFMHALIGVGF